MLRSIFYITTQQTWSCSSGNGTVTNLWAALWTAQVRCHVIRTCRGRRSIRVHMWRSSAADVQVIHFWKNALWPVHHQDVQLWPHPSSHLVRKLAPRSTPAGDVAPPGTFVKHSIVVSLLLLTCDGWICSAAHKCHSFIWAQLERIHAYSLIVLWWLKRSVMVQ